MAAKGTNGKKMSLPKGKWVDTGDGKKMFVPDGKTVLPLSAKRKGKPVKGDDVPND